MIIGNAFKEILKMAIIELGVDETVAVIKMNNGENRHNKNFSDAMNTMLDDVIKDASVTSIILTSTDEKSWSQGLDLEWMMKHVAEKNVDILRDFLMGMDSIFRKLLLYPVPVIAAINGHCFANGAILASSCDFRFMRTDRGFFCLPEVDLNIQFAPAMKTLLFHKYPHPKVNELMLTGRRATAPELESYQLIEKACPGAEETMKESMDFAKTLNKNRDTFAQMKQQINKDVVDVIDNVNPGYFETQFKNS
jgi:enoyl-CoA hydratase/carnithine racemase